MKTLRNLFMGVACLMLLAACDDDDNEITDIDGQDVGARNLATLIEYVDRFEQEDTTIFSLLASDVTDQVIFNPDGSQNPIVYPNPEAVIGFLTSIFQAFDNISFIDRRFTVSEDGNTIFLQTRGGDWVFVPNGQIYRQTYMFRVDFNAQGEVAAIEEYINWIVNGEVTGTPLGSCGDIICTEE